MGVGFAFIVPKDARSSWRELLERQGIEIVECLDEISEEDRDFYLSAGTLRCPWGTQRYNVQTCPLDVPVSAPDRVAHYVLKVYYSDANEKRHIKKALGPLFKTY